MNPSLLKSKSSFGYDSARPSFITTGTPIFGYDALANWFTVLNFEASSRTAANFRQFTAKERDSESGLDYFGARYYGSALGRFTSADNGSDQDPGDPKSWNLYSYVRNSPVVNTDPTGNCTVKDGKYVDDGGDACPASPQQSTTVNSDDSFIDTLNASLSRAGDFASGLVDQTLHFINAPRDTGCLGRASAAGGAIGTGVGMVAGGIAGIETGPGAVATAAAGGVILGPPAAAIGYGVGLVTCMSGSGQSSGGGGSSAKSAEKLSTSAADEAARKGGFQNAEDLKKRIVGPRGGRYDLYVQPNGDIEIFAKGGAGEGIETGINIKH